MTRSAHASVVIVTYNSGDCLAGCLSAVGGFFDWAVDELIIVDNHSTDDTLRVISRESPGAVVIANEANLGFARAANLGMRASAGDYVVLVNPDVNGIQGRRASIDELIGDASVAAVAVALVDDAGAISAACRTTPTPLTIVSEDLSLASRFPSASIFGRHRMHGWDRTDQREVEEACGAFLVLSRAALDQIGDFDERYFLYYEETDWLRRAREANLRVVFTPDVRAVHASGRSSAGTGGDVLELLLAESMYLYVRKWYGRAVELGMRIAFVTLDGLRGGLSWVRGPAARERGRFARSRLKVDVGRGAPRGR